jgi:hypothetical protein
MGLRSFDRDDVARSLQSCCDKTPRRVNMGVVVVCDSCDERCEKAAASLELTIPIRPDLAVHLDLCEWCALRAVGWLKSQLWSERVRLPRAFV